MPYVSEEKSIQIEKIKNSSPIFVIGCQRSGTSFLYRLIQKYLKIGFGRDNGHFIKIFKKIDCYGDLENEKNLKKLINDILFIQEFKKRFKGLELNIDDFVDSLRERTYRDVIVQFYAEWAYLKKNIRWGGKTPDYTFYVQELRQLFPDAKFIHIIRDGRDIALSLAKLNWGPKNAFMAAHYWKRRVESALQSCEGLNESCYMEMRYESLLQKTSYEFERLVNFIEYEEDVDEIMSKFNEEVPGILKKNNFYKWKEQMSDGEIRIFEQVSGDLLDKLGYDILHRDIVGKEFYIKNYYYMIENILVKLMRGEGFVGMYNKSKEFSYDLYLKMYKYMRKFIINNNVR